MCLIKKMDNEFTLFVDIKVKKIGTSLKGRTGLFISKPIFKITAGIGKRF